MQTHRMKIIDQVFTILVDATDAGDRVYKSRQLRISSNRLPALQIYLDDEIVSATTVGSMRRKQRQSEVVVVAVAKSDEELEQIIGQIEIAIESSSRLGGLVKDIVMTGLRFPESEGAKQAGIVEGAIGFRFTYYTREGDPSVAL